MHKHRDLIHQLIEIISKKLLAYLKATFQLAILSFIILSMGLLLMGIDFWFLKAFVIALVDVIPVLGSGIVMVPWALIHLMLGNGTMAWQIGLLYIVVVATRQIAEPIITGKSIGVRPIYTFLATVVSVLIFGPIGAVWGAVIAIVIKAILEVRTFQKSGPRDDNPFYENR